jgi:hypothetical protein
MLPHQVAIVAETTKTHPRTVSRIAAALQKQVIQDFGPIWGIDATVDAFMSLDDVPLGYWPIIVESDIQTPGAAGIHEDKDGQPFALVEHSNTWSLTASHEALEMLADPWGRRLHGGQSVKPDQGRVEYLVEVCDPCETADVAYRINGLLVSDFYTPKYFDSVANPHVRYSFTGAISAPRQVLPGGYLSWHDPTTGHWWQVIYNGTTPTYRDLGSPSGHENLRHFVDGKTPFDDIAPELSRGLPAEAPALTAQQAVASTLERSTASKASSWREQVAALKGHRA